MAKPVGPCFLAWPMTPLRKQEYPILAEIDRELWRILLHSALLCQALSKSIKSIREGEVVGDHTVVFDGLEETIELRHHAKSRDIFAQGALLAAKFAANSAPDRKSTRLNSSHSANSRMPSSA